VLKDDLIINFIYRISVCALSSEGGLCLCLSLVDCCLEFKKWVDMLSLILVRNSLYSKAFVNTILNRVRWQLDFRHNIAYQIYIFSVIALIHFTYYKTVGFALSIRARRKYRLTYEGLTECCRHCLRGLYGIFCTPSIPFDAPPLFHPNVISHSRSPVLYHTFHNTRPSIYRSPNLHHSLSLSLSLSLSKQPPTFPDNARL